MKNVVLEEQMELGFAKQAAIRGSRRSRPASPRRAGWWFEQMRTVVDKAMDFKPRPAPPVHQIHLELKTTTPNW
jgi:hypothetical protein